MALVYIYGFSTSKPGGQKGLVTRLRCPVERHGLTFYVYDVTPCIVGIFFKFQYRFILKYNLFCYCLITFIYQTSIAGTYFAGVPTSIYIYFSSQLGFILKVLYFMYFDVLYFKYLSYNFYRYLK